MTANQTSIYALIAGNHCDVPLNDDVLKVLYDHNLLPYFFSSNRAFPVELQKTRRALLIKQQLEYQLACRDLVHVVEALEAVGIEYRVLKGIAIAQTYPYPYTRIMGDHDICVRIDDFDQAIVTIESLGYQRSERDSTESDVSFFKKGHLKIELHRQLFDHGLVRNDEVLLHEIWADVSMIMLGSKVILVPHTTTHFKYLIIHLLKHLTHTGFGIRNLIDIVYFCTVHAVDCKSYQTYFDDCGYGSFYRAIISICVYELGMKIEDHCWLYTKDALVISDLSYYIIQSGAFGYSDKALIRRIYSQHLKPNLKKHALLKIFPDLFPNFQAIGSYYSYVTRWPVLLPVAWVHRWLRFTLKTKLFVITKTKKSFVIKDRMMKALGLYD
jgi:Uncharacterised nucleotidyltransferase